MRGVLGALQVARGILQELDFRNEARNSVAFAESLEHLGYVTVPKTIAKYSGRCPHAPSPPPSHDCVTATLDAYSNHS